MRNLFIGSVGYSFRRTLYSRNAVPTFIIWRAGVAMECDEQGMLIETSFLPFSDKRGCLLTLQYQIIYHKTRSVDVIVCTANTRFGQLHCLTVDNACITVTFLVMQGTFGTFYCVLYFIHPHPPLAGGNFLCCSRLAVIGDWTMDQE